MSMLLKFINFYSRNRQALKELGLLQFLRLRRTKKFVETYAFLRGHRVSVVDSSTFLTLINEIFGEEIYKFNTPESKPVIFDCGTNIGLATLYFKMRFPEAEIHSFEPDKKIFNALKNNIESFGFSDVNLYNAAVSETDGEVTFESDGGLSGMISNSKESSKLITVKSIRLKELLKAEERIDFLKIDIEGYERYVLPDIKDELRKVKHLFLEYHSFIGEPQVLDGILNELSAVGFRYYIKESESKKDPFINRVLFYNMDTVINIFCYRD